MSEHTLGLCDGLITFSIINLIVMFRCWLRSSPESDDYLFDYYVYSIMVNIIIFIGFTIYMIYTLRTAI